MSQSLRRGLAILEALDDRSVGVRELARRLGVDKGALSRTLTMLAHEGWVVRDVGGYQLGPRAQALGVGGASRGAIAHAARIGHVVSGLTGASTHVMQLVGPRALLVATTPGPEVPSSTRWEAPSAVWATAGGIALLAQLPPAEVEPFLAEDPWPRYSRASPADAGVVRALVEEVRAGGAARESGWSHPAAGCIALPWPSLEPGVPASFAIAGWIARIDEHAAPLERLLRRAVAAGATPEQLAGDGLVLAPAAPARRSSSRTRRSAAAADRRRPSPIHPRSR